MNSDLHKCAVECDRSARIYCPVFQQYVPVKQCMIGYLNLNNAAAFADMNPSSFRRLIKAGYIKKFILDTGRGQKRPLIRYKKTQIDNGFNQANNQHRRFRTRTERAIKSKGLGCQ